MAPDSFWSALSAICALVATVVALVTIWITLRDRRVDRQSRRPYFTIPDAKITPLPESPPYRIEITFTNQGLNPATKFEGKILLVDAILKEEPIFTKALSIGDDLPNNIPKTWTHDILGIGENVSEKYIVFQCAYFDPLLKEEYSQSFFMKWAGMKDGTGKGDFQHATKSEKTDIEEYLKKNSLLQQKPRQQE